MISDTAHMPGIHAGSFLIPGANGLPDLEVLTTDPAGWVSMQIAARQSPTATTADPQGNATATPADDGGDMFGLKAALKGFAVAGGMILLAVLLVVLGAWQFTKE